jgi:hypothetical protein
LQKFVGFTTAAKPGDRRTLESFDSTYDDFAGSSAADH